MGSPTLIGGIVVHLENVSRKLMLRKALLSQLLMTPRTKHGLFGTDTHLSPQPAIPQGTYWYCHIVPIMTYATLQKKCDLHHL